MRKIATMCVAAALAACFAGTVSAQPPGGGGRGMAGGGMMGGNVYSLLATNKALQEELKITDDQKKKLEEVTKVMAEKRREAMTGMTRDASEEERKEMQEKMVKLATESKKAYEGVLTAEQAKRTAQINIQNMKVRAFSDKDVQAGLKMGDDQKEKIKTIMEAFQKDSRELMGGGRGGAGGGGAGGGRGGMNEETRKKVDALTKETEEKIVATLSDDQKKSWKEMIGEKFDVSKLTPAPARPRDN